MSKLKVKAIEAAIEFHGIQYTGENASELMAFTAAERVYPVSNGTVSLEIGGEIWMLDVGNWMVKAGGNFVVLPSDAFAVLFEVVE